MSHWTIGIDEAGRGPLAGPVAVGVCAVEQGFDMRALTGIRDSKTLSAKQRDEWYEKITALPELCFAVELSSAMVIDTQGIQYAVRDALNRALSVLALPHSSTILLDGGLYAPTEYTLQRTIIRGDATEPLISAAAILAKVTRDRLMTELDRQYPEYGFALHKGYGTVRHQKAIHEHGLSALHRQSFCTRITQ